MLPLCENYVLFSGTKQAIKKVELLFAEMQELELSTGQGQYPAFFPSAPKRHFYNIVRVASGDDYFVSFDTKYYPNIHDLLLIADQCEVFFKLNSKLPEMGLYEKYVYKPDKSCQHARIDPDDFFAVDIDPVTNPFDLYDCFDRILDFKLALLDDLQRSQ